MPSNLVPHENGPFRDTIKQLAPNRWLLGSSLLCERHEPADISCAWTDIDGSGYSLQTFDEPVRSWTNPDPEGPIVCVRTFYSSSVWRIGNSAYFKSCLWSPEIETEATTIEFVQQNFPNVPVPSIMKHYIDEKGQFSHLLMRTMPGEVLNTAWESLSEIEQQEVAHQVADIVKILSSLSRDAVVSATGKRVMEPYLMKRGTPQPTHFDCFLDPDCGSNFETIWGKEQNEFVFYHQDLGPTNIMVERRQEKVVVSGILDWAGVGFLPKGFIATKPSFSPGFEFEWGCAGDRRQWMIMLRDALIGNGFQWFAYDWAEWFGLET
ncbi:hypothetical protein L228DRAFT_262100 [Xylona heveae TC161]|uniref:Aminoglycoside phosphotransferase domain-containing protein n=1 Tax=Xylona heveae (strain CBS 132557 / TC161) TaxID=1328760 RepID=A0A165FIZ1_XYLHT|nr:hypothetical protein L228DRAFT_262100 [Xylona heveae TC161]KZF21032.1 hypothetical protein L228DRAFT_262100 [Xylona heveae TC161]